MKEQESLLKPLTRDLTNKNNKLAKRLYRNNSLNRLNTSLLAPPSLLSPASMLSPSQKHSMLIPSISLRKLHNLENSQPSLQISKGKIFIKKSQELPFVSYKGDKSEITKKKAFRKFQKIDTITQKSIIPDELKLDYSFTEEKVSPKKSKNFFKSIKNRNLHDQENLTPQDFFQLLEEDPNITNEFCYLKKMSHPYDLKIIQFDKNYEANPSSTENKGSPRHKNFTLPDQYITISAKGVTYFNSDGSRFVPLQQWRQEARYFKKLMQMQFFSKYRVLKNFTNWKKYSRKIAMKKTTDKLRSQLLVDDRYLRSALIKTKDLCCKMENETVYCILDDTSSPISFSKFKTFQDNYIQQNFQKRISEIENEIKNNLMQNLTISMKEFKQDNKISSNQEGKGIPLLIGDEKNLEMPYTKEATLRIQQQKFKRFLKLVEILIVHSKINMMDESTNVIVKKIDEQNKSYSQHLSLILGQKKRIDSSHFKGKQYIECYLHLDEIERKIILKPSQQDLNNLFEDIVNKSIIKLVRNHKKIMNDSDINDIIYDGTDQPPKESDSNTLKAIMTSDQKQQNMVSLLNTSLNTSYRFIQQFANTVHQLVQKYFFNQSQLNKISQFTSQDYFNIREFIDKWKNELVEINKLSEQYESAIFVLNFKTFKQLTTQCTNQCLTKMKEVVPVILQNTIKHLDEELKQSLKMMELLPIGIEFFIQFQTNKANITSQFDYFDQTMVEIGFIIDIIKQVNMNGQTTISKYNKQRKELQESLKTLKNKIEEAEMQTKVHQTYAQEEVKNMTPKIAQNIASLYNKTKLERTTAQKMVQRNKQSQKQFLSIQAEVKKIQQYRRFLGMQEFKEDSLVKYSLYFSIFQSIWQFKRKIEVYEEKFYESSWIEAQVETIKKDIENFIQEAEDLKKKVSQLNENSNEQEYQIEYSDDNIISSVIGEIKKKMKPLTEAIECIKDPSLDEKQYNIIKKEFERKGKSKLNDIVFDCEDKQNKDNKELRQLKISLLISQKVTEELDFLKKVVFKSKKQLQLNSKITAVNKFWSCQSLNNSSKNLIDNFSQYYWTIIAEIDEKITVINCVKEDPEAEQTDLKTKIQTQKNMFDSLKVLLTEWEIHQNYLTYFEPIFSNPYWKNTNEFKAYSYAQANWKKLTKQISKDFSLKKLASQQKKHIIILKENNALFQQLKLSVQLFLNSKRQSFPKFYFISNEQLLHILLEEKDYNSIEKHLNRIFPSLKSLDLSQERSYPLGVRNLHNEYLAVRISPKATLEIDDGFKTLDERIKQSIRSSILKCTNYYMQDDFNRKLWINENILQVLLLVGNVEFTKLIQYDYLQPGHDDLSQLLLYENSQIKQLHSFLKDQQHHENKQMFKLEVLIMQGTHFRDIVSKLINLQIEDQKSYDWQKEIRSYCTASENAYTKYLNKSIDYGYQFVCPNYSFAMSTLSQRNFIELFNTISLNYLPVIDGRGDILHHFCIANAKNHFKISATESISSSYIDNLCVGALSTGTFLEIRACENLTQANLSIICNYLKQIKFLIQKKQAFQYMYPAKNCPTNFNFGVVLYLQNISGLVPLQQKIKLNYRVLSIPQISISVYLNWIMSNSFINNDQFCRRVEKAVEIINKCANHNLISLEDIRRIVTQSLSYNQQEMKDKIYKLLLQEITLKTVNSDEIKLYTKVLKETILKEKQQENDKSKPSKDKDYKSTINDLIEILNKKSVCLIVGPSLSGKKFIISEAYSMSGFEPIETYNTDLISSKYLLGYYENDIWKEGILIKKLKKLAYSQEQWILIEGILTPFTQQLLQSVIKNEILLSNGEVVYISPNWKFIFCTQYLAPSLLLPSECQILISQKFISLDERSISLLESVIKPYFKNNIEAYCLLKNLCVNNFEKMIKFRIKGQFIQPQHLLKGFIAILESVLSKTSQKILQNKQINKGVEKLFFWSLFWTVNSTLTPESSKKFQNLLFEQVKTDIDRNINLRLSRFEFDCPLGSFKKIQCIKYVDFNEEIYYCNQQRQSITRFIQLLINQNKFILLTGNSNSGKSKYLTYLKNSLGEQNYSFLTIRLNRNMDIQNFQKTIYKKLKISIHSNKKKYLTSSNGKKLVFMIDDFNAMPEGPISHFLRSCISHNYYYETRTNEKIELKDICFVVATNHHHAFYINMQLLKQFKPIYLDSIMIKDFAHFYHSEINSQEYSQSICHNITALHDFVQSLNISNKQHLQLYIDTPSRIYKCLTEYKGSQNVVKIWQYLSIKNYINSTQLEVSEKKKIQQEIKNYTNLILKNNQELPQPIQNPTEFIQQLQKNYNCLQFDTFARDYYIYIKFMLSLKTGFNIFTISEPLAPSIKKKVLFSICSKLQIEFYYPHKAHEMQGKAQNHLSVVYCSDTDDYSEQIIQLMMDENKKNNKLIFIVDFSSIQSWKNIVNKHPSILHYGARYIKSGSIRTFSNDPLECQMISQIEKYNEKAAKPLSNYHQQQISLSLNRFGTKIKDVISQEINKQLKFIEKSSDLSLKFKEIKSYVQNKQQQIQMLQIQEEKQRKYLLKLKNNYSQNGQNSDQEIENKSQKIQNLQTKLTEIIVKKRTFEDELRIKNEQNQTLAKIMNISIPILQNHKQTLKTLSLIKQNSTKIAVFLAIFYYLTAKSDQKGTEYIQRLSSQLIVPFEVIMEKIYGCSVKIQDRWVAFWLLNDKKIIIEDNSNEFASQIQKYYKSAKIFTNMNDFQDLHEIQSKQIYIIIGQIRQQLNYLNDLQSLKEKQTKDKSKNAIDQSLKQKENKAIDKYIKEFKQDKPDYSKNIYFIEKDKKIMIRQVKEEKENKEMLEPVLPSFIQLKTPKDAKESREDLSSSSKIRRRESKTNTIINNFNLLSSMLKKQEQSRQKKVNSLKNQITYKIKSKISKLQAESYHKGSQNQLQDFLTFTIEDELFHKGCKKISSAQYRNTLNINNLTIITKNISKQINRQKIYKYTSVKSDQQQFTQDLLSYLQPQLTSAINNISIDIQRLENKKANQQNSIIDKIIQSSQKSLSDIAKKEGDFLTGINQSYKSYAEKINIFKSQRTSNYADYINLSISVWKFLEEIKQLYPLFMISYDLYKNIVRQCLIRNQSIGQNGEQNMSNTLYNIESSKSNLVRTIYKHFLTRFEKYDAFSSILLFSAHLHVFQGVINGNCKNIINCIIKKTFNKQMYEKLKQNQCFTLNKDIQEIVDAYLNESNQFFKLCYKYIKETLLVDFQAEYLSNKAEWINFNKNMVVIGGKWSNIYKQLANSKNYLLFKQNNCDGFRSIQSLSQNVQNIQRFIFIDFKKAQIFAKFKGFREEEFKERSISQIYLFSNREMYERCQFAKEMKDWPIIHLDQYEFLPNSIERIFNKYHEHQNIEIRKVTRLITFEQLQYYLKLNISNYQKNSQTYLSCFYNTDFINSLWNGVLIKDSKELIRIACDTIYRGKQKWLLKQSKKIVKKDEMEELLKVILYDTLSAFEQHNIELSNFILESLEQTKLKISTLEGLAEFIKNILPQQAKKLINYNMLYNIKPIFKSKIQKARGLQQASLVNKKQIEELTFQSFKNLQSLKIKKQTKFYRSLLKTQNIKAYIFYRFIEKHLKILQYNLKSNKIISDDSLAIIKLLEQTITINKKEVNISDYLKYLQEKIYYIQEIYNSNRHFRVLNIQTLPNFMHIASAFAYSGHSKSDFFTSELTCRYFAQKEKDLLIDNKDGLRGFIIQDIDLKNCKFDLNKCYLEVNEKNENKKLHCVAMSLFEKQALTNSYSLPLNLGSMKVLQIQLGSKLKEESNLWRQKPYGELKRRF